VGSGVAPEWVLRAVLASSASQRALLSVARGSDRQQVHGLARTARSGPRRLILADLKLAQTCLYLMRAESQTRLRPRAHALTTEIARMLVMQYLLRSGRVAHAPVE
jgi:hypothetical protein